MRSRSDDRGSGSLLAVAVVAALAVAVTVLLPLLLVLPVKHRVKDAADASALAAADAVVGLVPGPPCDVAGAVAAENGASVLACHIDGLLATVTAGATVLGSTVTATSTAGPPDAHVLSSQSNAAAAPAASRGTPPAAHRDAPSVHVCMVWLSGDENSARPRLS